MGSIMGRIVKEFRNSCESIRRRSEPGGFSYGSESDATFAERKATIAKFTSAIAIQSNSQGWQVDTQADRAIA